MRDFSDDLADLRRRLDEAAHLPAHRRAPGPAPQLETEAGRPDLWDDQEQAKRGHRRAARRSPTTSSPSTPSRAASKTPRRWPRWPARRATTRSSPRSRSTSRALRADFDRIELRSLFSGEYDEHDAICELHSGEGGADAQDWAEMLLRMYLRWAEQPRLRRRAGRGHRGHRGRHLLGHVHRQGSLRLRAAALRARRAPAGAHQPVQRPGQAPDRLRRPRGHPAARRGRDRRRDRRQGPARSTCTGPRAPAASTSTRPTRRCGSPTCPPASSCRARTSAASTRTRTGP